MARPLLDVVLGVSRRRRRLARAALGTGLLLLRPALRRGVWVLTSVSAVVGLWWLLG